MTSSRFIEMLLYIESKRVWLWSVYLFFSRLKPSPLLSLSPFTCAPVPDLICPRKEVQPSRVVNAAAVEPARRKFDGVAPTLLTSPAGFREGSWRPVPCRCVTRCGGKICLLLGGRALALPRSRPVVPSRPPLLQQQTGFQCGPERLRRHLIVVLRPAHKDGE